MYEYKLSKKRNVLTVNCVYSNPRADKDQVCHSAPEQGALEGVGDEEMLDGQGGMAESNRNPNLMKC